jgi:hypothetical protein
MSVIFCLTRGYPELAFYQRLVIRNNHIARVLPGIPLLLFHQGNIHEIHQEFIKQSTPSLDITFVRVPFDLRPGQTFHKKSIETFQDGSCYPGYHLMCEFNTCHVWKYIKNYNIGIRIDEDCFLDLDTDWKKMIADFEHSDDVFRCPSFAERDSHELTNETLLPFLNEKYGTDSYYKSACASNLYMTKTDFWKRHDVLEFLDDIERSEGCIMYRWGDAPLIDIALNMFAPADYSVLHGAKYYHESHKTLVDVGSLSASNNIEMPQSIYQGSSNESTAQTNTTDEDISDPAGISERLPM